MKRIPFGTLWVLLSLLLCACGEPSAQSAQYPVQIVLEQNEGYTASQYVCSGERGGEARFTLTAQEGYTLVGVDCPEALWDSNGVTAEVTVPLEYTKTVSVQTRQSDVRFAYMANGGDRLDGGESDEAIVLPVTPSHLRLNTSTGAELFEREGYTLIGWNTKPDGSGTAVGLGSRIAWQEGITLYAQWAKWTQEERFLWQEENGGAVITGYTDEDETLVIPAELGGLPVYTVGKGACAEGEYTTLILPRGLRKAEEDAFARSKVETVYLSDDIGSITDYAFSGCEGLHTLHVNALKPPVYSGNYFATYADKFDRLLSLQGERKLILFSGSSARFGYDSERLEEFLPGYSVVNMGVFAYTGAAPQFLLLLDHLQAGDILLHSPEFDAAKRQFCTRSDLEDNFWCMMEANYDMAAELDLRECSSVFAGLNAYLNNRLGMQAQNYGLSPSQFDEDGNPVPTPSYNEYGDYILYRPNAESDAPVYGLPVDYTAGGYPKQQFLDPLNAMYQRFLDRGVTVLFTYAPRNEQALSPESTPEARAELDAWFRANLIVPVISPIEESLYPGRYLYGTDNHLSTEGVAIRTQRIARDLLGALGEEGEP